MPLRAPPGYRAHWLSDPNDRALVEGWISRSPERNLYSTPSYVNFARAQNGRGDLLWLTREGSPVLGLPVHPVGALRIVTGYSGAMFAEGPRDAALRRGVAALRALLAANTRLGFEVLQSAQSPAYDDPAHVTSLAFLLASHRLVGPSLYSRILDVEPLAGGSMTEPDVRGELLLEHGLRPYQAELRNQVRQALRRGLHVTCALPSDDDELLAAYAEFTPLHAESWRRTGMTPHRLEYWTALARAILDGGGKDMVVCAREDDGRAVAAVTCHLRGDRALYWAGASNERGLAARANPLCLHAAIQACRQLGVRHFELGRFDARELSPKEIAITRYKAQFGGDLVRVGGFRTRPPTGALVLGRALGMLSGARRRLSVSSRRA
jgi:ribosomal protein S18 acetylase RimI-like enzyme